MSLTAPFTSGHSVPFEMIDTLPSKRAGGASSLRAGIGGTLYSSTQVSNSGSSENDIESRALPANLLNADGQILDYVLWGSFAANASIKRVRVYFGATTAFDSGAALALNNYYWKLHLQIKRVGATSQLCMAQLAAEPAGGGAMNGYPGLVGASETLSGAVTFRSTITGASSNDITTYFSRLAWLSEGN